MSSDVLAQLTEDRILLLDIETLTKINVKVYKCELPTVYWLPKLHKNPYKPRRISNASHCSTTILLKHITSALTVVKDIVINYSESAFSNSNVNYYWSLKTLPRSSKSNDCVSFRILLYHFRRLFHLYTSMPHELIKAKVLSLVNLCFNRESKMYPCTSDKESFLATRSMTRINVGLALNYVKI